MTEPRQPGALPDRPAGVNGNAESHDHPAVSDALEWAEVAAMLGDYADAVAWLEYVERADGQLPDAFAERRADWSTKAAKA
jgi:hypothetical protein